MSIIYEALKKVQKTHDAAPEIKIAEEKTHAKPRFKIYLLYILIVCLGLSVANAFFVFLSQSKVSLKAKITPLSKSEPAPAQAPTPISESNPSVSEEVKKVTLPTLVLNGVFASQNEGYALINNQIVRVGDVV